MPASSLGAANHAQTASRLLIGLLLGIILCLPSWLMPAYRGFYKRTFPEAAARWSNDGNFTQLALIGGEGEDQVGIAARTREVARTWIPGDPYTTLPTTLGLATRDTVGFYILAVLYRLSGSLDAAWILARLLATAVFFLALANLSRRLGAESSAAVFVGVFFTLFLDVTISLFDLSSPLSWVLKTFARTSLWLLGADVHFFGPTRFMRPAFDYPPYLLAGLAAIAAVPGRSGRTSWARGLAAGMAGGSLAYCHFDGWTVFCVALALLLAACSLPERRLRPHGPLLLACVTAALLSLPFFLSNYSTSPAEVERSPLMVSHEFYWPSLVYLAGAALFWRRRGGGPAWLWLACTQGAVFLLQNMGLLFPIAPERYYLAYVGNVTLLPGLAVEAARRIKWSPASWLWASGVVAALAVGRSVSFAAQAFPFYALPKDYESAFSWLSSHASPGDVVATLDGEPARLMPVYTDCKVLATRANRYESDLTNTQNLDRTAYGLVLFVPPAGIPAAVSLFSQPGGAGIAARQYWLRRIDRAEFRRRPAETLFYWGLFGTTYTDRIESREHIDFSARIREGLTHRRGTYRVDWLWEGPLERSLRPARDPRPPAAGDLAYENATVRIFKIRPPARP